MKACDHTSVGILVWKDERLLLIERARFPPGFAVPAGHVDADLAYEDAARRELKEEVGLDAEDMELILEMRKENPCRREGGTWHNWKIYKALATGDIVRSKDETKRAGWYARDQIKELADRTEKHLSKEISDEEFARNPGLEPVMYELFKELKMV